MIKIIILSGLIALSNITTSLTNVNYFKTDNIIILPIEEKSSFEFSSKMKAVFFLEKIDDSSVNKRIKNIKTLNNNSDELILNVDVQTVSLGEYYVNVDGSYVKGELIGTEYSNTSDLNVLVDKIITEIKTNDFDNDYIKRNAFLSNNSSFQLGSDWAQTFSTKINASLDYEGLHYGDFSEWKEIYYIKTNKSVYYLVTNETYSTPNTDNTDDFRTSKILYDYNDNSSYYTLRDYGPKARNPEATISFSSSIGGEINSDGSAMINSSLSASYTTIEESPKINDLGNMALDNVKIEFSYVDPWTESDPWYSYNKNQSMQNTFYIIKESRSNKVASSGTDLRTISIVRDDLMPWYDKTVNFNIRKTITLDIN